MLLEYLAKLAKTNASDVAVVGRDGRLTYAALDQGARRIAGHLVGLSIARGSVVVIYTERSARAVMALVGVMKGGAAYTILEDDGNFEENCHRLAAMGATTVIAQADRVAALRAWGFDAVDLDIALNHDDPATLPEIGGSDLAYVLFTSGSTGKPKGVAVSQGNVVHYVTGVARRLGIERRLAYAHASTLSADLGNTGLLLSLWTGGTLHVLDVETRKDPAALLRYLVEHKIEFLKITPSHWDAIFRMIGQRQTALCLDYLVLGGEALPIRLAKDIMRSGVTRTLANHYGPTETTVGVTAYPIRDETALAALRSETVPIGAPFDGITLLVQTATGEYRARAAEGELFIGGPSVAVGYVGDPEATARSFVTGIEGDTRFYRTGDHVRIDAAGVVEFIGRIDRQVKVNGYRVELGHVESVLQGVEGVDRAVAFFLEDRGRKVITAAIVPGDAALTAAMVKEQAGRLLPDYMVPRRVELFEEFPRNANGKTDLKLLAQWVEARLRSQLDSATAAEPSARPAGISADIRQIWQQILRLADFGEDDDFFEIGGDSLGAIQMIAELQVKGYDIAVSAFVDKPTLADLVRQIEAGVVAEPDAAAEQAAQTCFSAAQDWFFAQDFAQPDHYNQAIILSCSRAVDADALRSAVDALVHLHPLLRTAFRRENGAWQAQALAAAPASCFGVSALCGDAEAFEVARHIEREAATVQGGMNLARGEVFSVRLFKFDQAPNRILLVAHHLSIDVVSWHRVIADLVNLYDKAAVGEPATGLPRADGFWHWSAHLAERVEELRGDLAFWRQFEPTKLDRLLQPVDRGNTEGAALTAWLGFSREETAGLTTALREKLGAPLHSAVLAAFAAALLDDGAETELAVDIESHGRLSLDRSVDIARVVGWFTSTYPLPLTIDQEDFAATVRSTWALMAQVPQLGVAYGLLAGEVAGGHKADRIAPLCFNYLGEFRVPHNERLGLSLSRDVVGPARGDANNRIHPLKLTARVLEGRLVADLSFSPAAFGVPRARAVVARARRRLLALADLAAPPAEVLIEQCSSTGLLAYVPEALDLERLDAGKRAYRNILLTGANGYVGIHVLERLLRETDARIYCLMRAKDGVSSRQRLDSAWDWYFPAIPAQHYAHRITVVEGDVGQDRFGLSDEVYARLAADLDAIYHFAANTRLFGGTRSFQQNIDSVRAAIALAGARRLKHLHYMSTLAVCGVNSAQSAVVFSEERRDIGQEFQNEYERTKFEAECLVEAFADKGGTAFIYRSGNVSAHSVTGRFQRNSSDNRFIQFLSAVAKLGKRPRELGSGIVLSPIDTVAAGIVAISLSAKIPGGVFHVDSPWEIGMDEIFEALHCVGVSLHPTHHRNFEELFAAYQWLRDADIALGYFWARRKPRNVLYSHDRTLQTLDQLGCVFDRPNRAWLKSFLQHLVLSGDLEREPMSLDPERTPVMS